MSMPTRLRLPRPREGQRFRRQGRLLQGLPQRLRRLGGVLGQALNLHGGMLVGRVACD